MNRDLSFTYNLGDMAALQAAWWAKQDACADHYPKPCPDDCPNKGTPDT